MKGRGSGQQSGPRGPWSGRALGSVSVAPRILCPDPVTCVTSQTVARWEPAAGRTWGGADVSELSCFRHFLGSGYFSLPSLLPSCFNRKGAGDPGRKALAVPVRLLLPQSGWDGGQRVSLCCGWGVGREVGTMALTMLGGASFPSHGSAFSPAQGSRAPTLRSPLLRQRSDQLGGYSTSCQWCGRSGFDHSAISPGHRHSSAHHLARVPNQMG